MGLGCSLTNIMRTRQMKYKAWLCPYHFSEPRDEIHAMVMNVLQLFLPFAALSIFNIGIISAVRRSKHDKSLNKSSTSAKSSSITSATILVTMSFLIFQTPTIAQGFVWEYWEVDVTKTIEQFQRLSINLSILLESANFCFNSYLYVLPCSRLRKEMFDILFCRRMKLMSKSCES
jgi:hypothetical protein